MKYITIKPFKKPVIKTVCVPGSKSFTNRALVMAALAKGKSKIINFSKSDDCLVMINALEKLGVRIVRENKSLEIFGNGGQFDKHCQVINVGHAGTAMRFLTALCALVAGEIILDGSERMRERPIGDLVNALNELGAKIIYLKKEGFPAIKISNSKPLGGKISINGGVSSQFLTALLLIASTLKKGIEITVKNNLVSRSYIDMTIAALKKFGITVINNDYKKLIIDENQKYKRCDYVIEGDASSASYFFAIAAITGGRIRVTNINPLSKQGDIKFPDILEKMGCSVIKNVKENWIEVKGPKNLKGIKVDMSLIPDTAQTLAVVAAFTEGQTKITGLSTLTIKETNRLRALQTEMKKIGIKSAIDANSITIVGGKPKGSAIETYGDHRMAMAFAIAGTKISGIKITDPDVVKKSFPDFWEKFKSLGIKINRI